MPTTRRSLRPSKTKAGTRSTTISAIAWLGRGDYTADEWADAVAAARERHSGPTSEYLLGIPVLPDYLEEGLAAFGLSCTDFEADHL